MLNKHPGQLAGETLDEYIERLIAVEKYEVSAVNEISAEKAKIYAKYAKKKRYALKHPNKKKQRKKLRKEMADKYFLSKRIEEISLIRKEKEGDLPRFMQEYDLLCKKYGLSIAGDYDCDLFLEYKDSKHRFYFDFPY